MNWSTHFSNYFADANTEVTERITDALASLHWLRVPELILFKVAVLSYTEQ